VNIVSGLRTRRRLAFSQLAKFSQPSDKGDSDMSVYQSKASPFYHRDFQIDGNYGTTKTRNRRDAEAVKRQLKKQSWYKL
jgi:hypothetical protein